MLALRPRWTYDGDLEGNMWVHVLPRDVVGLDFDAPAPEMVRGGKLRDLFWNKVHNLCQYLAEKYEIGRFWAFSTTSGFHIIFEKPIVDWHLVMKDASDYWLWGKDGPRQAACKGHIGLTFRNEFTELRVGPKIGRKFDIEHKYGSLDGAPDFVREHATMIEVLRRLDV